MLGRFGSILGAVAAVAKALQANARQRCRVRLPGRWPLSRQFTFAGLRSSAACRLGASHRYDLTACIACGRCADDCPTGCVHVGKERIPGRRGLQVTSFRIDYARCLFCGLCSRSCPVDCLVADSSRNLSTWGGEQCVVDFCCLPGEVAWGPSRFRPAVAPTATVAARPARARGDQEDS